MTNHYHNLEVLLENVTFGQIEQATAWYIDAEKIADQIADNLDTTLEVGASVISAFSPRERWSTNIAKAVAFSLGEEVKGLSNNIKMAKDSLTMGFDALKGQKTNAFARAIAGDEQAVVIDVWMMRAAGEENNNPNKTQYKEISQAVTKLANKHGMTPRTMQALLWILIRGWHE